VNEHVQKVNAVLTHKEKYRADQCVKAKEAELNKLQDLAGQNVIPTTWVLSSKGNAVKRKPIERDVYLKRCASHTYCSPHRLKCCGGNLLYKTGR